MLKYILLAVAVILTAIFIVVRLKKGGVWGLYTKTIASIGFVVLGLLGAYENGLTLPIVFMLLGLICGMLGDIVLDLKVVYKQDNNPHLNAGMLCFGVGHVCYFIALTLAISKYSLFADKTLPIILISALIAVLFTIGVMLLAKPLLKLDFGKFKIQTILYTFALSFMTSYAIVISIFAVKIVLFAIGLGLILISDLVLSNQYFGGKQDSRLLTFVNHAIYYMGQIAIAMMIYFI